MIKKIRRKLVWGYTLAIISIMACSSTAGILALNYFVTKAMQNSLMPELAAEVAEAKPTLVDRQNDSGRQPDITYFDSSELAFTVMEYWFDAHGELVMAEGTKDISALLLDLLKDWDFPNLKVREVEFHDEDGQEWIFIILTDDVYDDNGKFIGKVAVATNMTPLIKLTHQGAKTALTGILIVSIIAYFVGNYFAAKATKPIEVTMQKQRDFVSDASHELRTPLSVLLASVDTLEPDDGEEAQTVGGMRTEIINMRNLINSLLTLARSDNNKDVLNGSDFDLREVAANAVKGMQYLASGKNIKIIYTAPGQPVIVYGDAGKIRQLFNILLDNAIKYSFENMAVLLDINNKHNNVTISLQDYGVGIEAENLEHIFERFFRIDKSRSRMQGGFGLGLAIAAQIVEIHQGGIAVKSTPGKGSIFTVTLPVLRDNVAG